MNKPVDPVATCTVSGGEKLPAESGGADALCGEIRRIVETAHAGVQVAVRVKRFGLEADVRLRDGRVLPAIGFAMSDARLNRASFTTFARSIADAVEKQE